MRKFTLFLVMAMVMVALVAIAIPEPAAAMAMTPSTAARSPTTQSAMVTPLWVQADDANLMVCIGKRPAVAQIQAGVLTNAAPAAVNVVDLDTTKNVLNDEKELGWLAITTTLDEKQSAGTAYEFCGGKTGVATVDKIPIIAKTAQDRYLLSMESITGLMYPDTIEMAGADVQQDQPTSGTSGVITSVSEALALVTMSITSPVFA